MLITEPYRELYRRLYATEAYGTRGVRWASVVDRYLRDVGVEVVLDYGCGKGTLSDALAGLGYRVRRYDPALPGIDEPPREPAEAVVSTDALEHVEPACLDDVLDHVRDLTLVAGFHVISCRPARRRLPDGSDPHRSVLRPNEWTERFEARFSDVASLDFGAGDELVLGVRP